jgi:predicted DNA-binding WGR domain protein
MGRWGAKNIDSDGSRIFLEEDYAPRFLKARDHNTAWGYFFKEWSRLPAKTQDTYGVEYLLGVIELWVWDTLRARVLATQRELVTEYIEEHGPQVNSKHPSFLYARLIFALAQLAQQAPSAGTKEHALQLIDWNREAIRRLGLFGGPQSKGGKAASCSLRKLQQALGGEGGGPAKKKQSATRRVMKNADAGTRYFEFTAGASRKFWEITPAGNTFSVRHGRIGSKGRLQEKTFADEPAARAAAVKIISQKTRKGYREVRPS